MNTGGTGNSNVNISFNQVGQLHDVKEDKGKLTGKFTTSDGRTFEVSAKYDEQVFGNGVGVAKKIEEFFQNFESKELAALSGYTMSSSQEGVKILKEGNIVQNPETPPELKQAKQKAEESFKRVFESPAEKTESFKESKVDKPQPQTIVSFEEVKEEEKDSENELKPIPLELDEPLLELPQRHLSKHEISEKENEQSQPLEIPEKTLLSKDEIPEKQENEGPINRSEEQKEKLVELKPRSQRQPRLQKQEKNFFKEFSPHDLSGMSSFSSIKEKKTPPPPPLSPQDKAKSICAKYQTADENGKAEIRKEVEKLIDECLSKKEFGLARQCRSKLEEVTESKEEGLNNKIQYAEVLNEVRTTEVTYLAGLKTLIDVTNSSNKNVQSALKQILGDNFNQFKGCLERLFKNGTTMNSFFSLRKEQMDQQFSIFLNSQQGQELANDFVLLSKIFKGQIQPKISSTLPEDQKAFELLVKQKGLENGLPFVLIIPVQRGPRYELLSRELLKSKEGDRFGQNLEAFGKRISNEMNLGSGQFVTDLYASNARIAMQKKNYRSAFESYKLALGESKGKKQEELRNEIFEHINNLSDKKRFETAKEYVKNLDLATQYLKEVQEIDPGIKIQSEEIKLSYEEMSHVLEEKNQSKDYDSNIVRGDRHYDKGNYNTAFKMYMNAFKEAKTLELREEARKEIFSTINASLEKRKWKKAQNRLNELRKIDPEIKNPEVAKRYEITGGEINSLKRRLIE